jgi:tRNA U54 and U55 pseudouridine synthase Pus10
MKRKIPEEIFDEIIQAVEEKEAQKQIFMNLQISVQDTLKREDGTKEYLKKEFLNKYGRPVSTEYLSTVEVVLEKDQTDIRIVNESIFICGRYRKNKRGISNTPMLPTNRHPIQSIRYAATEPNQCFISAKPNKTRLFIRSARIILDIVTNNF